MRQRRDTCIPYRIYRIWYVCVLYLVGSLRCLIMHQAHDNCCCCCWLKFIDLSFFLLLFLLLGRSLISLCLSLCSLTICKRGTSHKLRSTWDPHRLLSASPSSSSLLSANFVARVIKTSSLGLVTDPNLWSWDRDDVWVCLCLFLCLYVCVRQQLIC